MALPTASDNAFPSLLLTEGSAPSSPAAGKRRLYVLSADHLAYLKDSSGAVVSLISNPLTTGGDTLYGGASGVPTRLANGGLRTMLTAQGGTTAPAWNRGRGVLPLDAQAAGSGDLFGGTSLDGGWSSLQTTGLTSNDRSVDGVLIQRNSADTAGKDRGLQRAFAPAGDFTVSARLDFLSHRGDFVWAGVFAGAATPGDGAGGARVEVLARTNGGSTPQIKLVRWAAAVETDLFDVTLADAGWGSGGRRNTGHWSFPFYVRVRRSGTTLIAGISHDGVEWAEHSTTTTISFSVATCGVFIGEATATDPIKGVWGFVATTG